MYFQKHSRRELSVWPCWIKGLHIGAVTLSGHSRMEFVEISTMRPPVDSICSWSANRGLSEIATSSGVKMRGSA